MAEIKKNENKVNDKEIGQFCNADWRREEPILHSAVSSDDIKLVKQCIQLDADVNEIDYFARTALFYCRSIEIAKFLVDNGTDVNILDFRGETAVVYLYDGKNSDIIKYLAGITNLDLEGKVYSLTLLHKMIFNKETDLPLFEIVIPRTKNINRIYSSSYLMTRINYSSSYLMNAVLNTKYLDVIKMLIESGIDLYIRDRDGKNFYDLASKYVQKEIKKNYPEFMKRKDMKDQQRQRFDKLLRLNSISN